MKLWLKPRNTAVRRDYLNQACAFLTHSSGTNAGEPLEEVDRYSLYAAAHFVAHKAYAISLELPHEAHFVANLIDPIFSWIATQLAGSVVVG